MSHPAAVAVAQPGTLHVVATPIGHLADLSQRARQILSEVDVVLCEDTRTSAPLLRHAGSDRPLRALHEHNEQAAVNGWLAALQEGQSLALISDAGTPLLSDPGYRLVAAARAAGLPVSPVPGPCAVIAALSVAGLATDRFSFEGFLPAKAAARRERLRGLADDPRTLVFYEAPHRIADCLSDMLAEWGSQRPAALCRELTKTFETVILAPLAELQQRVAADSNQQRGEIVLVVAGAEVQTDASLLQAQQLYRALLDELPPSRAAKVAAKIHGVPRRALYGADD
ncbi:MAG: 16S rRNA (cytidine(1402)-2'-O)-methyltransferase [Xanthomonadales bacterium]|nr:16S rRNA (cytidine(1402)-2'-O)-methyltransferase [Xanthomonadales bacterium]MCB1634265.1 16S rRNA (cytidine(1402)-2'-O)-methyltransferase [Xanthomonadales bacterium]MCB1643559.1 16S rRNA (cytidine(1402)-2'-O)-methyltransferase [Xanthomonadales bacterium]